MKKPETLIEIARAKKPNQHMLDVYVEQIYIDNFGKRFVDRKLFDTIVPSEKSKIIAQIHNIYGIQSTEKPMPKALEEMIQDHINEYSSF